MSSRSSMKKKQEKSLRKSCEIRAEEACLIGLKSAKSSNPSVNTTISKAFSNSSQFCSMRIPFDGDDQGCPSLNRRRIIGARSRGMQVSATVVISFHPHFITQMDKMYHLQCFYSSRNNKMNPEQRKC
uniref:Cuticlin N-terminal domain-containing protein n=1 Tax=Ditylenchus dipsaci TaxID=166011 RepID=A0A915CLX5_9BILA